MRKLYIGFLLLCSSLITYSQNVGIGTDQPLTKLHVVDTVNHRVTTLLENRSPLGNGSIINLRSTNGFSIKDWYLGSGIYGIGQDKFGIGGLGARLIIDDLSGNLGIGVDSPVTRLSNMKTNIIGSDGIGINGPSITWSMNTQGYVQSLYNKSTVPGANGLAVKIAGTGSLHRLLDLSVGGSAITAGTPVMIVRGDGKVGIGTNNPGAKLSLGVSWPEQRLLSLFDDYTGNNAYGMGIEPNPDFSGSRLMIYTGTFNPTDAVTFGSYAGTTYNEAMRVQKNGYIGIGITSPQAKLHITGSGITNQLRFDDSSGPTVRLSSLISVIDGFYPYIGTSTTHPFSLITSNTIRLFIDNAGNVGIGTMAPSSRLHVNGQITSTSPLNVVSDIRYKKNIEPLQNAVNTVSQLKGVSYQLRQEEFPDMNFPSAMQIGFIAQEVEKVLPAVVTTDKAGNKGISYTSVIPLLVEAIKEQQQQIDALRHLVEELVKSNNK